MKDNRIRVSSPDEERVYTWRMSGTLHNKLMRICKKINISANTLITSTMQRKIEDIENKLEDS